MEENAKFSADVATIYDDGMGPYIFEPYAIDMANKIASSVNVSETSQVLELACGTGRLTTHLLSTFPPSTKIIASDLNVGMIDVAKKRISASNITFQEANIEALPFESSSFDLVVCQYGFMFCPNKEKAFAEAFRVLKPGGKLLFNVWGRLEENAVVVIPNEILKSLFPEDPPQFFYTPFCMYDVSATIQLLEAASFREIVHHEVCISAIWPSKEFVANALIKGAPIYHSLRAKSESAVDEVLTKVADGYTVLENENHEIVAQMKAFVYLAEK